VAEKRSSRRTAVIPTRRERERGRHELEVLAAAERVFARTGVAGATMAEIAREAQFAVGTLYKFFPSKEALFERLLLEQLSKLELALGEAIVRAPDAPGRLEALAVAHARFAVERRAFLALFASPAPGVFESPAGDLPAVLERVARKDALLLKIVRDGVRRGELTRAISPELVALTFESALRAYLLERVIKRAGAVDEDEVRRFARALVDGLGA
jgi:AcrR family transcriptional regulator